MIDFSKYTLQEMQAIVTVLDDLTNEMSVQEGYENDFHIALSEYMRASARATALINQQARDQQAKEVEKVQLSSLYGKCVADAPPADPPAEPDMFGWVGDALDDLCAAGEVLGSNE